MDGIDLSHLPQEYALVIRFGHHLAGSLPAPKGPLLYREDAMSPEVREQSDSEGDTPAPQRPYVYLVYATCKSIDFGRGSDVHVSLPRSYGISRRHFSLCCDPATNIWSVICHSDKGVVVNGARLTHTRPYNQWALSPLMINHLEAPSVSIKVAVQSQPWDSNWVSATSLSSRTVARSIPDNMDSWASESSVTESMSSWMDGVDTVLNPSRYIVLRENEWRLPWADRAWVALDARTGGAFAVTETDTEKGDKMLRFFVTHSSRILQHPNLMTNVDYQRQGTMGSTRPALVQENGPKTAPLKHGLPQRALGAAARQMIAVLSYLQEKAIYHGRIRAEVITYQYSGLADHHTYRLTGLWERWLDPQPLDTSSHYSVLAKRDMATMGALLASTLPRKASLIPTEYGFVGLENLAKPLDPVLYQILWLASCTSAGSATQFQEHLSALLGGDGHSPFFTTQLSRQVAIDTGRSSEHQEPEISVRDIATLWEWHMRTRQSLLMSYDEQYRMLLQLRRFSDRYVTMGELNQLAAQRGAIFDTLRRGIPRSLTRNCSISVNAEIHWLRGGAMINLTQFLAGTGLSLSALLPEDQTIEMLGATALKGLYVDYDWVRQQEVLKESLANLVRPPPSTGWPRIQLAAFPYAQYVMFATDLPWGSIVVMDRSTGATHWQPTVSQSSSFGASTWLTYTQTIDLCEEYGLHAIKEAMREYRARDNLYAPKKCQLDQPLVIPKIDDQSSWATFIGVDDRRYFKRKKRS
ncbi:Putative forkhead-associated (FHA) domain, SMAD/FHA domain superfamily [Septoria linicola]|uniref:Forkhead-associated (FHA) domain, SMAD/FHA domain superfamily n=1 Tax=Septoria linicola TaxID=215465 RepID=A0A9Q9AJ11_9PEZI|nr:putative forkhead-associated (FHA) domain, SMAD/FHA domain superfamily [Septoria linicola]USW50212.1 Putative forkhead-associated (FHA) domain, SMAD/FHA domain superfamily [Septoria linicola]